LDAAGNPPYISADGGAAQEYAATATRVTTSETRLTREFTVWILSKLYLKNDLVG
jgi:hypothetical protein